MYENIQVTIMEDDQPYGIQFYDGQGSYHLEIDIKDRDQRNILTSALASKHIPLFMGIKKERVHCDPLGQISDKMKPVAEELVNTLRKGISHYNSELQRIYQLIRDIILDIESRL